MGDSYSTYNGYILEGYSFYYCDERVGPPIGALKYSDWNDDDLKCVLPAFCHLIIKAKKVVENTIVIINTDLKNEITEDFIEACKKIGVRYLCLKDR